MLQCTPSPRWRISVVLKRIFAAGNRKIAFLSYSLEGRRIGGLKVHSGYRRFGSIDLDRLRQCLAEIRGNWHLEIAANRDGMFDSIGCVDGGDGNAVPTLRFRLWPFESFVFVKQYLAQVSVKYRAHVSTRNMSSLSKAEDVVLVNTETWTRMPGRYRPARER